MPKGNTNMSQKGKTKLALVLFSRIGFQRGWGTPPPLLAETKAIDHLRHGKMSKSRFSVDFRHPVSPVVALGVCCSTFANKMAVT